MTFCPVSADLHRHLADLDRGDAESDRIEELAGGIRQDTARVGELIWNADSMWACDAIAHAMATGDWLFVQHQAEKHVGPLIRAAAEEDAAAQDKSDAYTAGEARYDALQDARDFA